jgi:hypothetical protein
MDDLLQQVADHEQVKAAQSKSKKRRAELNATAGREWRDAVMIGTVTRETLTDASAYDGVSARVKGGQQY